MSILLSVLIIDEDPIAAKHTKKILQENSLKKVNAIIASSLAQALQQIHNKKIDSIILDSPDLQWFRTINQSAPHIPIIIVTDIKHKKLATAAVTEGAQDYCFKGTLNGDLLIHSINYAIERKKNEHLLSQYAIILENSHEAIIHLTSTGVIKSWNSAAQSIYLYSEHEIIGQPFISLLLKDEHDYFLKQMKLGVNITNYALSILDKKHQCIASVITVSPVKNNLGEIIEWVILAKDDTHDKKVSLQSSMQLHITRILSQSNNIYYATRSILKIICEYLGFLHGEIWANDSDENVLRYIAFWSINDTLPKLLKLGQGMIFHLNEGLAGYIWAKNTFYWSNTLDKEHSSERKTILHQLGVNSCFGFPIQSEGTTFGVALFYGTNIENFDIELQVIFETIGEQVGAFFKYTHLSERSLSLAQHDPMTGIFNRIYLYNVFHTYITQAKRQQTLIAFLYFDIDFFQIINESLGYRTGDLFMIEIVQRVLLIIGNKNVMARLGGDEFAVILLDITNQKQIDMVAEKILEAIAKPMIFENQEYYITASMGISIYPNDGNTIEDLFKSADISMYHVKKSGKNNYQYAITEENTLANKTLLLNTHMHQAIEKNEFILYYQPIIDVQSNKIVSVEALIRWIKPSGEMVSPENFIPQLEKTNLMLPTGLWVLKTACQQIKTWNSSYFTSVSVNVSVRQLNKQLVPNIQHILKETGLNPSNLILEITESMLIDNTDIVSHILDDLDRIGVHVAIDDFGTGYSSFAYLKALKIQYLKIDKSFISCLNGNERSHSIVNAIILMAHALGLQTIAEGVEVKEELDFLKENHCDMYQGYYFSQPLPPDELEQKFAHVDN